MRVDFCVIGSGLLVARRRLLLPRSRLGYSEGVQRDNPSGLTAPSKGWDPLIDTVLDLLWKRPISQGTRRRINHYLDEVVRWGNRVDLTAARTIAELVDLSLADAAVVAKAELENGRSSDVIVDVGTGGGAPGIPLLILLAGERGDAIRGTLVEPRSKRTAFLRSVVGGLSLPGVEVTRARSDALRAKVADVAVARATLGPTPWLVEGERLSRRSVWVLLAREPAPHSDRLARVHELAYLWPLTGAQRRAVCFAPSPAAPR